MEALMISDNPRLYRFNRPKDPTRTGWHDASQVSTPMLWLVIIVIGGICLAPLVGSTS